MQRSMERIITTQVGSLPRPIDLRKMWDDRLAGRAYDPDAFVARVKSAVADGPSAGRVRHRRRE